MFGGATFISFGCVHLIIVVFTSLVDLLCSFFACVHKPALTKQKPVSLPCVRPNSQQSRKETLVIPKPHSPIEEAAIHSTMYKRNAHRLH